MSAVGGVKGGATVSVPRAAAGADPASSSTNATATTPGAENGSEAQAAEAGSPSTSPRDVYERGGPTSPRAIVTSQSAEAAPAGDPALANDLRKELTHHNAAAPQFRGRTVAPRVADGGEVNAAGASAEVAQKQDAFVSEMRAGGVQASQPPTPDELRAYFATFNNRADRPKALSAYERYADAYHVHPASTDRPDADVRYSVSERYGWQGRYYGSMGELERASERHRARGHDVDFLKVNPAAPDGWSEVTSDRASHEGRHVNDCEGFTFLGQELLGAAGYRTRAVAVDGPGDTDHAMLVAKDPSRPGQSHVLSNERLFSPTEGRRSEAQLLDDGYTFAGGQLPARYFQGATQDEAQSRMVIAADQAAR